MKKTTQREREAFPNVVVLNKMPTEGRLPEVPLAFALAVHNINAYAFILCTATTGAKNTSIAI